MIYTAYRGEHGDVENLSTRHGAITFCNDFRTCEEYARYPNNHADTAITPRVLIASVTISCPLLIQPTDPFIDLKVIVDALGVKEAMRIAEKYSAYIEGTNLWQEDIVPKHIGSVIDYVTGDVSRLSELYFVAYPYFDCREEVARLVAAGFDGVVIGSSGFGAGMIEYRPFSRGQVTLRYTIQL